MARSRSLVGRGIAVGASAGALLAMSYWATFATGDVVIRLTLMPLLGMIGGAFGVAVGAATGAVIAAVGAPAINRPTGTGLAVGLVFAGLAALATLVPSAGPPPEQGIGLTALVFVGGFLGTAFGLRWYSEDMSRRESIWR